MEKDVMRLQLFAEDGGPEEVPEGEAGKDKEDKGGRSAFDEFLSDPANQSEFDKRVAKALEKQKASLSEANKKAIEDAQKEAEKLAKMNADQKKDYAMEQLKDENERLKAEHMKVELGRTASNLLKDSGIDATDDILSFVVGSDAEATKDNIDKFVSIIQTQVKAAEVKRATGSTPKDFGGNNQPISEIDKRIAKYRH